MKLCTQCHEREGVINLTHIKDGEVRTDYLCAKCAAEKGIQTTTGLADTPLGGFLAALGHSAPPLEPLGQPPEPTCPGCGATLRHFRETGRVGCSECYRTFEEPLRDLLRRLHGSTHHTGATYHVPGAKPSPPRETMAQDLREQLRRAIEAEQFELAAQLRDRLKEGE